MFKKRMLLLSMLVASMLLVSCGKSGENGSGSEETEAKLVGSLSEIMDSSMKTQICHRISEMPWLTLIPARFLRNRRNI